MAEIERHIPPTAFCVKHRGWCHSKDFSKDKRKANGLSSWCRKCTNDRIKSSASYQAARKTEVAL